MIDVPALSPPTKSWWRVRLALTDGTDLKVWKRGYHAKMIQPPAVFGHELVGEIVAVGKTRGPTPGGIGMRVYRCKFRAVLALLSLPPRPGKSLRRPLVQQRRLTRTTCAFPAASSWKICWKCRTQWTIRAPRWGRTPGMCAPRNPRDGSAHRRYCRSDWLRSHRIEVCAHAFAARSSRYRAGTARGRRSTSPSGLGAVATFNVTETEDVVAAVKKRSPKTDSVPIPWWKRQAIRPHGSKPWPWCGAAALSIFLQRAAFGHAPSKSIPRRSTISEIKLISPFHHTPRFLPRSVGSYPARRYFGARFRHRGNPLGRPAAGVRAHEVAQWRNQTGRAPVVFRCAPNPTRHFERSEESLLISRFDFVGFRLPRRTADDRFVT